MRRIFPTIGALRGVATAAALTEAHSANEAPGDGNDGGGEDELDQVAPEEGNQARFQGRSRRAMVRQPEMEPDKAGNVKNDIADQQKQAGAPDLTVHPVALGEQTDHVCREDKADQVAERRADYVGLSEAIREPGVVPALED